MLTDQEFLRYSRQLMLPEFGEAGQQTLKQSRVLVVGVGGLGSASAAALCAAGIGKLRLLDADKVELSNLQRQLLFRTTDLGQPKVAVAAEALRQLNPHCRVDALPVAFSEQNAAELLSGIDWVLDGTDNFASRLLLSRACQQHKINLLSAAVIGQQGQLMLWPYRQQSEPSYHQVFQGLTDQGGNCASFGVLAPLPALIGHWQATVLIQQLLQPSAAAALWQLDVRNWQLTTFALPAVVTA